MTIPLTVKPRCSKTPRIYEPPDESEGTISQQRPAQAGLSRVAIKPVHPQLHRDIALFGEPRLPNWVNRVDLAMSELLPLFPDTPTFVRGAASPKTFTTEEIAPSRSSLINLFRKP